MQQHDRRSDRALLDVMARIARVRMRTASGVGAWTVALLVFLVALAVRLDMGGIAGADPFVTFTIAVVPITLAAGWRRAGCVALLGGAAGWFFFLRAPLAAGLAPPGIGAVCAALGGFAAVAGLTIALCEVIARAACAWTTDEGEARDPRLAALRRRARTAVRFVAAAAPDGEMAARAASLQRRFALFERLDQMVAVGDWAARMEAFCRAEVEASGRPAALCRVTGDVRGLDPDRVLAISLALGELAQQARAGRCGLFEAGLRTAARGGHTLEVRTEGCRERGVACETEACEPASWPRVAHWLAETLGASLTVSTDGAQHFRFDFPA